MNATIEIAFVFLASNVSSSQRVRLSGAAGRVWR